jgi:hypothetical protein
MNIQNFVDQIIQDRVLTKAEQDQFTHLVMADGRISTEERIQIERLTQLIEKGEIRVID